MIPNGWIKLHRKMTEWEWYTDTPVKVLFLHLLLTVRDHSSRWRGLELNAGSRPCGLQQLAEETALSLQQVRTAIKKLEATNELERKSTNQGTVITIKNYNIYQEKEGQQQTDNKRITNEQQTDNKRITTLKEIRNKKEEVLLGAEAPKEKKVLRGSRLPPDWKVSKDLGIECMEKLGATRDHILKEQDKFVDYWVGITGQRGTKLDWDATFRNWIRKSMENGNV